MAPGAAGRRLTSGTIVGKTGADGAMPGRDAGERAPP